MSSGHIETWVKSQQLAAPSRECGFSLRLSFLLSEMGQ